MIDEELLARCLAAEAKLAAIEEAKRLREQAVTEAWAGAMVGLEEAARLEAEAAGLLARVDAPDIDQISDVEILHKTQTAAITYLRRALQAEAERDSLLAERHAICDALQIDNDLDAQNPAGVAMRLMADLTGH